MRGQILVGIVVTAAMSFNCQSVLAQATQSAPLITEVQTGTQVSANEEFVELYNPASQPVDLKGWRLQFANSAAVNWQVLHRNVALSGQLGPSQYMVIASQYTLNGQNVSYLSGSARAWFTAGIAAAAGHVRLVYDVYQPAADGKCVSTQTVADEVEWSGSANGQPAKPSLDGRSLFVAPTAAGIPTASSLQRFKSLDGSYVDSNNDSSDFGLAAATPTAATIQTTANPKGESTALHMDACAPSATPIGAPVVSQGGSTPALPSVDTGLLAPQISELLPNPAAPATDIDGEYVELYNPNDSVFDLSGFMLKTGLTGTYSYAFPTGTLLPPKVFVSFMSKTTHLALSNTAGKATLLDPFGAVVVESKPYGKAPAGQAWIFADNSWRWTTQPTPNATNVISAPPENVAKVAGAKTTKAKTTAPKATKTPKLPKALAVKTRKKVNNTDLAPNAIATAGTPQTNPLHPGVLAVVATLAVLYGAYEYRHDVANKIRELRTNRAARRTPGPSA